MKLLDVVALTEDIPEKRLLRGQVGTVVEQLTPEVFEVEFADINGRTYALLALPKNPVDGAASPTCRPGSLARVYTLRVH